MTTIPAYVRQPKNITKAESLSRLGFYSCNTIKLSASHRNAHSREKQHKNFIETLFWDKGQKFARSKNRKRKDCSTAGKGSGAVGQSLGEN